MTDQNTGPAAKQFRVLLADDLENDRLQLKRAMRLNAPTLAVIREVENGREAIDYLAGIGRFADRTEYPFPDLLILDLKMPILDGFEVLNWLQTQNHPRLKVAILADVLTQVERQKALSFGVQHFYRKTAQPEELVQAVKILEAELVGS